MVQDVFALHTIGGLNTPTFPFPIDDYQRYVFGDDALAYRFGTELAKAFISRCTAAAADSSKCTPLGDVDAIAVAVLSNGIPSAPHALRDHFVAHVNRHAVANNAHPARNLELFRAPSGSSSTTSSKSATSTTYHIDAIRLQNRPLIIVSDFRLGHDQETAITSSLHAQHLRNKVSFVYLLALDTQTSPTHLSPLLSSIIDPSIETITSLPQAPTFRMNDSFVRFVIGRDHGAFCRVVRRLEDGVVRLFLEYAIAEGWYEDDMVKDNFKFLVWEVEMREGIA